LNVYHHSIFTICKSVCRFALKKLAKKQRYKVYENFHIKQKNFTAAEKVM